MSSTPAAALLVDQAPALDDLRLLNTKQAAKALGVTPNQLQIWRSRSRPGSLFGPQWVRLSPARVAYRMTDLAAWVTANTETVICSGTEPGA